MSAVTAGEMRELEAAAFRRGAEAGTLMDLAGAGIARRLLDHFPRPGTAIAFIGKGNNGGDALVVLDHLRHAGWQVGLRCACPAHQAGVLPRQRLQRLDLAPMARVQPEAPRPLLLLDGLLGIGAKGALREPLAALAAEMNDLRRHHGALVAAIDLPSGLDADTGELHPGGVVADLTLTVGVPKLGLFADDAANACGRLMLVPLEDLPEPDRPGLRLASPETFPGLLVPRPHDFHKGKAGRVSVLAGSPGMSGAAVLCANGALRGGAGLVTVHAHDALPAPAEIMVRASADRIAEAFDAPADARVIGPGLGVPADAGRLLDLLERNEVPAALDADALNLIAARGRLDLLRPSYLITPHPGEFARLAPDLAGLPRAEAAARFVERHPCTLLLKGARTLVAAPGGDLRINPTGHAGMASGGQGDVLSGICGALLASGCAPPDAAMLGAWLCGRAAERALTHGRQSEESCVATDTLAHLGGAFDDWRGRRR